MIINTIRWLPQHLAQMPEWKEICHAYDHLLSEAFSAVDEVYANQFLDSMTEIGCLIWERLLNITITENETIEERRQAIRTYILGDLPYTENKLRETLENIAGEKAVKVTVTQTEYELKIDLAVNAPATILGVQDIVYKMRPCNMIVRICVHYEGKNQMYVGHAIKQIKVLKPTNQEGGNPISGSIWYADSDSALLTDENGNVLVE